MENEDSIFTDINNPEVEASYMHRFLTNFIDWAIEILSFIAIYKMIPYEILSSFISTSKYGSYIFIIGWIFLYRFLCIFLFNKTIGMMICNIKYLNGSLVSLNRSEKLIAVFASNTFKIKYYKLGK